MAKRILIIEDNKYILEAVKIILSNKGYEIMQSLGADEALHILKDTKPDMIIMDLMMPGISGIDLFKMLKKDKETRNIPIIILTAKTDAQKYYPELKRAEDFIPKPFDKNDLIKRVEKVLEDK